MVRVELGKDSYDIVIGRGLGTALSDFVRSKKYSKKALVVTDSNVGPLYADAVCGRLREAGLEPILYTFPAGESSKTMGVAEDIYTRIIEHGLDRKSPIFALGGGVVGGRLLKVNGRDVKVVPNGINITVADVFTGKVVDVVGIDPNGTMRKQNK